LSNISRKQKQISLLPFHLTEYVTKAELEGIVNISQLRSRRVAYY